MSRKDPEEARAYQSAYYRTHRAKLGVNQAAYGRAHLAENRTRNAVYHRAHPNEIRSRQAAYRQDHPDEIRGYNVVYYSANSDKIRMRNNTWRKENPDKVAVMNARRRARKRATVVIDFTSTQWAQLKTAHKFRCAYCGKKKPLTQDHITPLAKGGNHTLSNIVPACKPCNSRKGTRPPLTPVQPMLLL